MRKSHVALVFPLMALFLAMSSGRAMADITSGRYAAGQVHDAQRNPAFPVANSVFTVSNLQDPYRFNNTTYQLNPGEYVRLFFVGGTCSNGLVGINRYDASGTFLETVQSTGHVYGLSALGFLHDNDSNLGTFFSAGALPNGGSLSYTPTTGPAPETCQSLIAYGVPQEPTTVQPPFNFRVDSVTGSLVTLRWDVPAIGPQAAEFVLEGGLNPAEVLASVATGSNAPVFTFVAPTGSFFIRSHGQLGADKSPASNEVALHVNVPVVPSAPAGLTGMVNGSSLALSWNNTFAGGPPSGLMLDVTGSIVTSIPLGLGESFAFAGVPNGTYTLALRATNAGGASPASNPVTVTFPGACSGAPRAPANFLGYKIGNTVFVQWDSPAAGPAPTGYVLNATGDVVGSAVTPGRSMSGTVGPGTYNLTVMATNPCGTSPASPVQVVTVP